MKRSFEGIIQGTSPDKITLDDYLPDRTTARSHKLLNTTLFILTLPTIISWHAIPIHSAGAYCSFRQGLPVCRTAQVDWYDHGTAGRGTQ